LDFSSAGKNTLLWVAAKSGGDRWLAGSSWRRDRLVILCYHGVSAWDEHQWNPDLYISPGKLEERLQFLKSRGYTVLPLADAVERLQKGSLPRRAVAITFDDGFADYATTAWPLLKRYQVPATVYLTTYYSLRQLPIFRLACYYLLYLARNRMLEASAILGVDRPVSLASAQQRRELADLWQAKADAEGFSAAQKDEMVQHLAERLGLEYAALKKRRILHLMRPEEVTALARDGADIQLHTHRHRMPQDSALVTREIIDNRKALHEMTGYEATHLCYPNGEYHREQLDLLERLNVHSATTTVRGIATSKSHRLLLPRQLDNQHHTLSQFESWLSGIDEFVPKRTRP